LIDHKLEKNEMIKNQEFLVIIEKDEDGYYIGEVPQLNACYSQGETIDELIKNIKEVIEMCLEELEENNNLININEFIGIQKVRV
jgi:predicted RNase H-like HicB family nuclease